MDQPASIFDRFFSQQHPTWFKLSVSLFLLLLPFWAAYLDGMLSSFFRDGHWRIFLLTPTIIIYIWFVSPMMTRMGAEVISSLRPLVPMKDESFDRFVIEASHISPSHERFAIGIGAVLGFVSALASGFDENASWLRIYWFVSNVFLYALLAWTIYISVASTRLNAALHSQPLRIDILDTSPFEAIGRQSLLLALIFVGGITLSLLLTFQIENLTSPAFWLIYLLLVLATVLIFFLSMRPTHQVLVVEKKRELEPVQEHIGRVSRALIRRLDQNKDPGELAASINALVAYEHRLQTARTWPYNTAMLRTLFFSIFIPLGTVLGRLAIEILFR